jgi:hypothetical protein
MRISTITFALSTLTGFAAAQETNLTISVSGTPVLALRIPQDANVTVTGDHTVVQTKETTFHVWSLSSLKTAGEALPRVTEIIKGEFVNFKPEATNEIVVADAPARHISGKGNEADDGDPGAAQIVLFSAGKHVFAACAHGEFDDAIRRSKLMMIVLKSAKAL